ncbi:MAG: type II toxin-antitoxin system RelE/ParE family toxin [Prosthecobacter sp.]|nr:type II toxin-antitoxin system RelE/ParE family toxin [Prosthecobacter sp.]
MSYQVELSPEAIDSIDEQVLWFETQVRPDGDALAERWLRELRVSLKLLARTPERHALAAENGKWHPEVTLRRMLFRPWQSGRGWRVLFWIDKARRTVRVLLVRHESRPPLAEEES